MRLLCALALISAVLPAQTIEGTATDALTGLPVPDVAIHLYKTGGMPAREAVTDSLGRFRIEGLPETMICSNRRRTNEAPKEAVVARHLDAHVR